MLVWVACAARQGHDNVLCLCCFQGTCLGLSPCISLGLCWYLWPLWISLTCTATWAHVDVLGLCSTWDNAEVSDTWQHWRPHGCLQSVLLPETTWNSMICALVNCNEQGSYFCSSMNDCRPTIERVIERFCDNSYHHATLPTSKK